MKSDSAEKDMARLVLGDLEPGEAMGLRSRMGQSPDFSRYRGQMEKTVTLLQGWGAQHMEIPAPAIPVLRVHKALRVRRTLVVAAALILLVFGVLQLMRALRFAEESLVLPEVGTDYVSESHVILATFLDTRRSHAEIALRLRRASSEAARQSLAQLADRAKFPARLGEDLELVHAQWQSLDNRAFLFAVYASEEMSASVIVGQWAGPQQAACTVALGNGHVVRFARECDSFLALDQPEDRGLVWTDFVRSFATLDWVVLTQLLPPAGGQRPVD